jgi:hypothetical protein
VRAYLGATNSARSKDKKSLDLTEAHPKDDMSLDQYYGTVNDNEVKLHSLAPLHLINVTINETVSSKGSIVNQDRKGLPLTVMPDGYLIDGEYCNRSTTENQKNPKHEALSLGRWIGISGAAFGPGLGRSTRPERSLLMVLTNIRLGYWWKAPLLPILNQSANSHKLLRTKLKRARNLSREWIFSTQHHLSRELRGKFFGTDDSHWYLSDGGHFENSGVYELLRRRVEFILALDNGADKAYQFEDLANLIRLASVDFGATFLPISPSDLTSKAVNAPPSLLKFLWDQSGFDCKPGKGNHFVLAYKVILPAIKPNEKENTSILLWVKPRLTELASLDLRQYQATHVDFPQESTSDQFFDDQQWESYRKLGQQAGDLLFSNKLWQDSTLEDLVKTLNS